VAGLSFSLMVKLLPEDIKYFVMKQWREVFNLSPSTRAICRPSKKIYLENVRAGPGFFRLSNFSSRYLDDSAQSAYGNILYPCLARA